MPNKPRGENDNGICPMSKIANTSGKIKDTCHFLFGPPNKKGRNQLGPLEGQVFIDFIENFLSERLPNIDFINPGEIVDIYVFGQEKLQRRAREMSGGTGQGYSSKLAATIYKNFIQEVEKKESIQNIDENINIRCLSIAFIEAFDAILLTGSGYTDTMEEWKKNKKIMWEIIINLTNIPSNIQEILTKTTNSLNNVFEDNNPYMLEHMEILSRGMLESSQNLNGVFNVLRIRGGYGQCPAAVDGTLRRAFDAMFDIYGEVLVKPKDNS